MHLTWSSLGAVLLWSAVAALAAWLALTPVRRRSLTGLLASLVLTGAAGSLGALWGAMDTMLIPGWDWQTMLVLTALYCVVAAAAALAVGRRLAQDNEALRSAVADLGAGREPAADGRRLTAEVDRVRRELRSTAAQLAATSERERALESARRELVSWVSHDLRTPLAGLRAMAEALEDGVVDDPELYYKQIGISVERLNQMVEDLFDLSRIQAGATPRDNETVALADLVSDCVAALEPLATAQGVRLTGSVDRTGVAGGAVTGSGRELNRALTNLVANAIRHTRAQGNVDVRVSVSDRPDAAAEVVVRDECGGIPVEQLSRVFDVGFRGEAARTPQVGGLGSNGSVRSTEGADAAVREYPGAGLGLAITRGIVEAHNGTVDVQNLPGGCQFRVRLPLTG